MKKLNIIAGLLSLVAVGTVAILNRSVVNTKRKNACKFVKEADDISISVIDETGHVVSTTSNDILVPIEELPSELVKNKVRGPRPLTTEEYGKIKAVMKDGHYTIMCIAKKYHLTRHQAYGIFYSIKDETNIIS